MESCGLAKDVVHQNRKWFIRVAFFVLVEIILLVPPYGSMWPPLLGFMIMTITAGVCLNRYFWIRMWVTILEKSDRSSTFSAS